MAVAQRQAVTKAPVFTGRAKVATSAIQLHLLLVVLVAPVVILEDVLEPAPVSALAYMAGLTVLG